MNDSSNWDDFIFPSPHPSAKNHLLFRFAQSGDCVANNNLLDFLSVASIDRMNSANGTVRITGSTLRLRAGTGYEKCYIYSKSSYPLILETPLAGTTGMLVVNGVVELRPSVRGLHTITGGFELLDYTKLVISKSWHLGAVTNTVEMGNYSWLRFNEGMTVSVPIYGPENSIMDTNTPDTVKLTQFVTRGWTEKVGPGTLSVTGVGDGSQVGWTISEGTLEARTGSIDSAVVTSGESGTLRLAADATPKRLDIRGGIDTNGYVLETERGQLHNTSSLTGDGVLRAVGPGLLSASSPTTNDIFNGFSGKMEASGGEIYLNFSGLNSTMTLCVDQPSDRIELSGASPYIVGEIEGQGVIEMSPFSRLVFGNGDTSGVFNGSILSNNRITKVGTGRQDLVGTNDLTGTRFEVLGGTLGLTDSAIGGATKIIVEENGTFTPIGTVNAPTVEGSGTVQLNSQTLTVGETNLDFALSGTLTGNIETSTLRKRGSGTFTLSADTTGFGGFFQINDGAVRFTGGPILPAAASLTVFGDGQLRGFGDLTRPYWNQGTIAADSSEGVLRLVGQGHWNNGIILAENGGTLELEDVFLEQDFSGSIVQGRLESDQRPIRLIGDQPVIVQGGTIETTGDGSLELIGTAITLREVDHSGHLTLRSGVDVTAENFDIVTGATHTLDVEFDPDVDDSDGAIRGHGTAMLGGMFRVTLPEDYLPAAGDSMTVIDGDDTGDWTIVELFESIELPDVSPMVMRVESNPDSLRVVVTCEADLAEPFGTLNFFDISTFISLFVSGDPGADFAAPFGTLNFFDVSAFINTFSSGCP
tara:strand:- start:1159 stop:3600 length:2442 start_codon:yes stop_codon:yes gene_type:complete